ncbi:glycosyltransferase [Streptomyces sp. GS7]|uniref:glycosyltransferase n=1 Tax=Streptomyces sp. GS7 TaxID=2692234 RepID=UPI0013195EF8|nr:glycosyltransferase [Streptomyces sp. GS7]QHC23676.1 glycosyltransferase [Streptomyces sp. GS7]
MRILITAAGSHGDVAPYTGLGVRLSGTGHEVALATHRSYASMVEQCGLEYRPLPGDPRADGAAAQGKGGLIRKAKAFVGELGRGITEVADPQVDVLLLSTTTAPLGWHVAEAVGAASVGVYLQPVEPTGEFAPVVGGARSLGRWGNRAAGRVALGVVDRIHRDAVRELRRRLGLPPLSGQAMRRRLEREQWPVLHGFSAAVVGRPVDWRPGLEVVGNWWPAGPEALPREVEEFLAAGTAPVFIGFGSMGSGQGERLSRIAVEALRSAGLRGVLQSGWAGLAADSDDVLTVGSIGHAALFPRMAAVVHHAGAGTAAAGLRAGVPSVPVPVTADQPFWAGRLAAIGVAVEPIPFGELTAERLAGAIRQAVAQPSYRKRAAASARRMAKEDGAGSVVKLVADLARRAGS